MSNLFIALTPLEDLDLKLIELKNKQKKFLEKNVKVNWSKDNQHHITLNYIGSMEPEQIEELYEGLYTCSFYFEELPIEISSISYFPNEIGQIFVANISLSKQLQKLYNKTEELVARIGFRMTLRNYKPHITLARFKGDKKPFTKLIELEEPINSIVGGLDVYKSELISDKNTYNLIKSISFK